jgi:HlyD family secretion protein
MRRVIPIIVILALIGGGTWWWSQRQTQVATGLKGSGTVEATQVNIGPEVAGRVVEVMADEGQAVKAGQVLIRLDDALLVAQRAQAEAAVNTARAQRDQLLASARPQQLAAARATISSTQASLSGAQADLSRLLAGATSADIISAQAQLKNAKADTKIVQDSYDAVSRGIDLIQKYHKPGGTMLSQAEAQVSAQLSAANSQVNAAQALLNKLQSGPTADEVHAAQARVAAAKGQLAAAQKQYDLLAAGPRREQIAAADAAVAQAEEALRAFDVQASKLIVRAPQDGIVMVRNLEVGEVVGAGATALVIGQLETLQLTVYLPEDSYGRVKLGQATGVTVDSYPGVTFPATVVTIADQAEFTPRNVQTTEGRRTTVYAVKLDVSNPDGRLKPGMPADVSFEQ